MSSPTTRQEAHVVQAKNPCSRGGFHKWGYPQLSSIEVGFCPINPPAIWAALNYGNLHLLLLRKRLNIKRLYAPRDPIKIIMCPIEIALGRVYFHLSNTHTHTLMITAHIPLEQVHGNQWSWAISKQIDDCMMFNPRSIHIAIVFSV